MSEPEQKPAPKPMPVPPSPLDRAWAAFLRSAERYEQEQRNATTDDRPELWRELMIRCGRATR